MPKGKLPSSFRDPSGFLFTQNGELFRQVNQVYTEEYGLLMRSGLYDKLVKSGLLIPHEEAGIEPNEPLLAFKVIKPERVPFISYPYEWSFSQLKDAALVTLRIQKRALKAGMSLKDASAYNIQFVDGKPLLIDTLSFEIYNEGLPWVAYRQFCQHFLAPLALMAHTDVRLSQLLRVYIDGAPLDLVSRLLPARTRLDFGLLTHIHIHASAQKRYASEAIDTEKEKARGGMSKQSLLGLIESLEGTVKKLTWKPGGTEWGDYYDITNYSDDAFTHKKELIEKWVQHVKPAIVWDLGANTGVFSRVASQAGYQAVAFDIDPSAVEKNYLQIRAEKSRNLLPLVLDLTNPSPAIGWDNSERESFGQRGPVDMVFALALIHHLSISNNVPLPELAQFFHRMGKWLVLEFVPKSDSQVQKLLASREDIFPNYRRQVLEQVFSPRFIIHEAVPVGDSERVLYLMEARKKVV